MYIYVSLSRNCSVLVTQSSYLTLKICSIYTIFFNIYYFPFLYLFENSLHFIHKIWILSYIVNLMRFGIVIVFTLLCSCFSWLQLCVVIDSLSGIKLHHDLLYSTFFYCIVVLVEISCSGFCLLRLEIEYSDVVVILEYCSLLISANALLWDVA